MTRSDPFSAPALPDWDYLVQPTRVHRLLYTSDRIFDDEILKIFGKTWIFVGHESEIPKPKDYKTVTVGRRPFIVARKEDGAISVLFNRCSHRGTILCREHKSSGKFISCPYHGWTFDLDGNLVSIPHREGYGSQENKPEWNLGGAAKVETYKGLIFASLSADVPSLEEHLGNARPYLDRFLERSGIGGLATVNGTHKMMVRANWKTCWDNSTDGYHPETSHSSILSMTQQRYGEGKSLSHFYGSPDDTDMYQVSLGNGHTFLDQFPAMGDLWDRARPTPGNDAAVAGMKARLPEAEVEAMLRDAPGPGMNLNIFPNLMTIGNQLVMVEPYDTDRFAMIWYATSIAGAPEELNTIRMRIAEDFPNLGEVDDVDIWEKLQEGLAIPEAEWIDMSRGLETDREEPETGLVWGKVTSDTGMRGYWREYHRLMTAPTAATRTEEH